MCLIVDSFCCLSALLSIRSVVSFNVLWHGFMRWTTRNSWEKACKFMKVWLQCKCPNLASGERQQFPNCIIEMEIFLSNESIGKLQFLKNHHKSLKLQITVDARLCNLLLHNMQRSPNQNWVCLCNGTVATVDSTDQNETNDQPTKRQKNAKTLLMLRVPVLARTKCQDVQHTQNSMHKGAKNLWNWAPLMCPCVPQFSHSGQAKSTFPGAMVASQQVMILRGLGLKTEIIVANLLVQSLIPPSDFQFVPLPVIPHSKFPHWSCHFAPHHQGLGSFDSLVQSGAFNSWVWRHLICNQLMVASSSMVNSWLCHHHEAHDWLMTRDSSSAMNSWLCHKHLCAHASHSVHVSHAKSVSTQVCVSAKFWGRMSRHSVHTKQHAWGGLRSTEMSTSDMSMHVPVWLLWPGWKFFSQCSGISMQATKSCVKVVGKSEQIVAVESGIQQRHKRFWCAPFWHHAKIPPTLCQWWPEIHLNYVGMNLQKQIIPMPATAKHFTYFERMMCALCNNSLWLTSIHQMDSSENKTQTPVEIFSNCINFASDSTWLWDTKMCLSPTIESQSSASWQT